MSQSFPIRRVLWLCAAAGMIAVQVLAPGPRQSLFWSALFNVGHAPLYGLVALVILRLVLWDGDRRGITRIKFYLLALVLTVVAGVLAELLQKLNHGDLEVEDVVRDAAGAAAFLLAFGAFDRRLIDRRATERGVIDRRLIERRVAIARGIMLAIAASLLAVSSMPLAAISADLVRRDRAFPTICAFEASWESAFVFAQKADMQRIPPPDGWLPRPADRVARIAFRRGAYPGLVVRKPHPNWTGFKELVFDVYSELPRPVDLVLSIHDIGHDHDYWDRFNRELTIEPGPHRVSIPLREIQMGPRGRQLDLSRICGFVLFANHPREPFVLYFADFHLE